MMHVMESDVELMQRIEYPDLSDRCKGVMRPGRMRSAFAIGPLLVMRSHSSVLRIRPVRTTSSTNS